MKRKHFVRDQVKHIQNYKNVSFFFNKKTMFNYNSPILLFLPGKVLNLDSERSNE